MSYADRRTADFAQGKWVKAFTRIEHAAQLKLDRLEAAMSLHDLAVLPGNRFIRSEASVTHLQPPTLAFPDRGGPRAQQAPSMWKLSIITEGAGR